MAATPVDAAAKHAFAYDGGMVVLIDEHTTVSKCGNVLKFSSIVSNSQHFLTRSKSTRITSFDANAKASHVAVAACEERAEVSIYSFPEKKLRGKLKVDESHVFDHYLVQFSRCGSRLLSVGTTPTSNELRVWDVDKLDGIEGCTAVLPTRVTMASFNPLDAQTFMTVTADAVTFWRICHGMHGQCCFSKVDGAAWGVHDAAPHLGKTQSSRALLAGANDKLPAFNDDGAADDDDVSTRYRYVSHCWSKAAGHIYLVNARSELVTLDSATGALVARIVPLSRAPVMATALALTAESLVVGFSDGAIRWLASDDLTIVLQTTALPHPITAFALSPTCVVLVAGTTNGGQYELKAFVEPVDDDAQDRQQQQQPAAKSLGINHTGAIVAVSTLLPAGGTTNDAVLVTGGMSGLLHVWAVVGCRSLAAVDVSDLFDNTSIAATSQPSFSSTPALATTGLADTAAATAVPIVSLAARTLDPILVLGDAAGRVRIVGLSKATTSVDLAPLHTARLLPSTAPIDLVELHPSLPLVLVASSADTAVFVMSVEPDKQFRVVAFIRTAHRPQLIKWVPTSSLESTYFLVSTAARGVGYVLVPNNLDDRLATELPLMPLGADPTLPLECHGGAFLLTPGKLLAYFNRGDKALHLVKVYDAPGAAKDRELKTLVLHAHAKPITAIARSILSSKDGQEIVATGGADGVVTLWLVQTKRSSSAVFLKDVDIDVRKQRSLPIHSGPVTALVFATCDDYLFVYSTGVDGTIFCIDVHVDPSVVMFKSAAEGASPLYAAIVAKDKQGAPLSEKKLRLVLADDPKPFLDLYADEQAALVRAKFEAVKDAIRGPLAEIQLKLKTMLQHNAELPETEALERHEFVVNRSQEAALLAQSDKRAKEVRRNISRQIAELNIVRDRMRVEFWDSGEVHGVQLHGLHSSLQVVNLPMRKLGKAEVRRFDTILRLRELEFHAAVAEPTATKQHSLHRRKSSMYHHGDVIPPNISWMVNAGLLHPSLGKKVGVADMASASGGGAATEKGAAKNGSSSNAQQPAKAAILPDATDAARADSDQGPTCLRLVDLIYHPAMIRTRNQQRTQIHLLQAYERHLIMQYNAEFDAMVKVKEAKMDEIEGKNSRMREICAELGLDASATTVAYKWHPDEIADSMMRLLPGEATKVPYETDERRKVREAAEAAARLQDEKNKKDDVAGRALADMMNGTLETKKETIVAHTVAREAWMDDVAPDDMTAEQKQKVAAFEAEAIKVLEDKEKARKALDLELKKLKVDVGDICRAFDDKLKCLQDLYLATRMSVLTQQMYILRLGEVLMDHEHCCHEKELLQQEIDTIVADIRALEGDVSQFTAHMDACREAWQYAVDEDKACEKAFPKEIEDAAGGTPLEHDVMRALVELYRKRRPQTDDAKDDHKMKAGRKDVGSTRSLASANSVGDLGNLDPFSHADRRRMHPNKAVEAKRLLPLDPDVDRPESIATDSVVWTVLNECRVKKITLEHVVRRKNDMYMEAKDVVDVTRAKVAALEDKADRYSRALHELVATMDLNSDNHPILVKIKQGQDEASGGDDLVTLFEETERALLIARRSVESLNATIMVHGNEQVSILGKIKNFRKNINLMEWEHAYLEMLTRNTEDHYTDLQLLRVTKNLQELITTGDASEKHKQEQILLESKLAYMGKSHQVHQLKLSKTTQALKNQLADRLKENEQFKRQLQDLQTHIHIREDIVASRRASAAVTSTGQTKKGSANPGKDNKLKAITVRRKLIDLAKAQSEEIEFMRQELDKIRRRTFPSFVQPMQAPGDDDDFFRD